MKKTGLLLVYIVVCLLFVKLITVPAEAAEVLSNTATTQSNIYDLFRDIYSRFLSIILPSPPVVPTSSSCTDTITNLKSQPNPQDQNRGGVAGAGKPVDCGDFGPEIVCHGGISATYDFLETLLYIFFRLTQDKTHGFAVSHWVYSLIADSSSPKIDLLPDKPANLPSNSQPTISAYWNGQVNQADMQTEINCIDKGDCEEDKYYKGSGVMAKLMPAKIMAPDGKEKLWQIALREKLLCHVYSGYRQEIIGGAYPGFKPANEYYAGYLTSGRVTGNEPSSGNYRPLFGIEIICRNPDFSCSKKGWEADVKDTVCKAAVGVDYLSGAIDSLSYLGLMLGGDAEKLSLRTPSVKELYDKASDKPGIFLLPFQVNDDSDSEITETVSWQDPDAKNQLFTPRTQKLAYPVRGMVDTAEDLLALLSSFEQQAKAKEMPPYTPECKDGAVITDLVAANAGGTQLDEAPYQIAFENVPPQTQTQGAYTENGQVLQAEDPPVTGNPGGDVGDGPEGNGLGTAGGESSGTITHTESRGITTTWRTPADFHRLNGLIAGKAGLAKNFIPYEIVSKLLNAPVNVAGTTMPPSYFSQKCGELSWLGDARGEITDQCPYLGGVTLLAGKDSGLLNMIVDYYDEKWNKDNRDNTGIWLKQLVEASKQREFSQDPWGKLASFQNDSAQLKISRLNE